MNRDRLSCIIGKTTTRLLCLWLFAGCSAISPGVDWQEPYAARLGQPIVELNETALNTAFQDERGNLTRMTWARLADGTTALLGLPAYGIPAAEVVARTVILTEAEWQPLCRDAIEQEIYGWSWSTATRGAGNTIDIYPTTQSPTAANADVAPDPNSSYCQLRFLPEGWVLNIVHRQGVVKPADYIWYDELSTALQSAGATVAGSTAYPAGPGIVLSVPSHPLTVNGHEIQVFVYADPVAAHQDAQRIAPDGYAVGPGEPGKSIAHQVPWHDTPHFYQWGRMIVIYVGENAKTLQVLEEVFGPPFAGG